MKIVRKFYFDKMFEKWSKTLKNSILPMLFRNRSFVVFVFLIYVNNVLTVLILLF